LNILTCDVDTFSQEEIYQATRLQNIEDNFNIIVVVVKMMDLLSMFTLKMEAENRFETLVSGYIRLHHEKTHIFCYLATREQ
jgi:hypothetical protein